MQTRPYKGVPAEQRRAERREKLVRAGWELFGTRGIHGTRVDDVCTEAGLTKRYFYESFTDLDDLVGAVVDEAIRALADVVVPVIAEHGWRNPRPVFEAFASALLADPRTSRLLVEESGNPVLAAKRQVLIDQAVDLWLDADPDADPDPDRLALQRLLAHAMAGAAGEVAVAWAHGRIDLEGDVVIDHLVRIFERITPARLSPSTRESEASG
ncbi:MAG: TetR/AcrR family transcriptional regulator [Nocardioidaceae bacterium]|nr:TetR/AcrR family transcriptional regulator [Nocardioidaceae bacterium]